MLNLIISSDAASSERRFDADITVARLKERLEAIVGSHPANMTLKLFDHNDQPVGVLADDSATLAMYGVQNYFRIHVIDSDPSRVKEKFMDVSLVEKYEMSEEDYKKRQDSVRAFKERNKIGRFADNGDKSDLSEQYLEESLKFKVGDRFETIVDPTESGMEYAKRGVIKYIGKIDIKPGYWVGVQYDEPVGKHNGTLMDVPYFRCPDKHGAFLRPNRIQVGDFPEENFDDMDEM